MIRCYIEWDFVHQGWIEQVDEVAENTLHVVNMIGYVMEFLTNNEDNSGISMRWVRAQKVKNTQEIYLILGFSWIFTVFSKKCHESRPWWVDLNLRKEVNGSYHIWTFAFVLIGFCHLLTSLCLVFAYNNSFFVIFFSERKMIEIHFAAINEPVQNLSPPLEVQFFDIFFTTFWIQSW